MGLDCVGQGLGQPRARRCAGGSPTEAPSAVRSPPLLTPLPPSLPPSPQALWLVQAPALPESPALAPTPTPAPVRLAVASPSCAQQAAPTPAAAPRPAPAPLAALRRGLRRLAGGLRSRLAAMACMARPATLESGGCPGRRLGNASSGASADWSVTHVNWS